MDESKFYNGNKLLSLRTMYGTEPEIFFCCGNRIAGKTFYYKRFLVRRSLRHKEKFGILVRNIDDVKDAYRGFWADIGPISFPNKTMTQKPLINGSAGELFIDNKSCGYVIPLRHPDKIKRNSALFADADRLFFDEFMIEEGSYLPNELVKFNSVRGSIARGGKEGKFTRYVPVYMCANNVTLFNPYFEYFGISSRIQKRTKYMRGETWVLEQTFNAAAAAEYRKTFAGVDEKELAYAAGNEYLKDDNKFVDNVPGNKYCEAVLRRGNRCYGVWMCRGYKLFVSRKYDPDCFTVFSTSDEDHTIGAILMGSSSKLVKMLKEMYNHGCVWFQNGSCRAAFIDALSIK